jgi:hypothetical protein
VLVAVCGCWSAAANERGRLGGGSTRSDTWGRLAPGLLQVLLTLLASLPARLAGRFGCGCGADFSGDRFSRLGRALGVRGQLAVPKLSRAASSRCVFGAPCAGYT